jgi:hypothetical protein
MKFVVDEKENLGVQQWKQEIEECIMLEYLWMKDSRILFMMNKDISKP